jgi:hypothetical protein
MNSTLAEEAPLSKSELADSLTPPARYAFLDRCAAIEKRLTNACAAKQDPCLASGCALDGEACLNAVLNADTDYRNACVTEWARLFSNSENRTEDWKI